MNTHSRIITELSAVEKNLDTVLFRRGYDDDEDDGISPLGVAGTAAAAGGVGLGTYGLIRKGQKLNATYKSPEFGNLGINQIGSDASARGTVGNVISPEKRFILPTSAPVSVPSNKGVLADLAAGARGFGGELRAGAGTAKAGIGDLWKKLIARGVKLGA